MSYQSERVTHHSDTSKNIFQTFVREMKVGGLSGAMWVFFGQDIFLVYGNFDKFNIFSITLFSLNSFDADKEHLFNNQTVSLGDNFLYSKLWE